MITDTIFDHKNPSISNSLGGLQKEAGKKIGMLTSDILDAASNQVETGRQYIKSNPFSGIAIAAAAGLVTGSIMTLVMKTRNSK